MIIAICNNKKCSLGECEQPETCTAYVPVITNADRIRAMSDEELAKMLTVGKGTFACFKCLEFGDGECSMKCDERCLEWLQQTAEGE